MALATKMLPTESNLVGQLANSLTSVTDTVKVRFYDKVSGLARVPLSTTKLFTIDKGQPLQPNDNYEIIYCPTPGVTSAGVTTFTGVIRGLPFSGSALTATGTAHSHQSTAEIGCVDNHYLWNNIVATLQGVGDAISFPVTASSSSLIADFPATDGYVGYVTAYRCFVVRRNGVWWYDMPTFADATERDAVITSPQNGMDCYNTGVGLAQDYIAGTWSNRSSGGTFVNMSTTVAGKGQQITATNIQLGQANGSTGAPAVLTGALITKTSSGSGDAYKVPALSSDGKLDYSLIDTSKFVETAFSGESLSAGDFIYIKSSDGFAYKASSSTTNNSWNVIGVVVTGGLISTTITYQKLVGEYTTTGLTAGATYYLSSTSGQLAKSGDAGYPAFTSGTVVPMIIGVAESTTKLVFRPQRVPRRVFNVRATATATYTVTVGFPISHASASSGYNATTTGTTVGCNGFFDNIAGVQGSIDEPVSSGKILSDVADSTVGNRRDWVASVDGSNNFVMTMTNSGTPRSTCTIVLQIFEAL